MKRFGRILTALCTALMLAASGMNVKAEFMYKVTILAGLHGTINGGDKYEVDIKPGEWWYPDDYLSKVTVNQETREDGSKYEKYYVKGLHISGIEDLETGKAQKIYEDTVFVVSYGVKGRTVKYTVRYQDAAGNTLHPTKTFYGNVNDKPVVSFQYIDGYVPNAYNLTKTLSEDESENIFTFTYHPGEALPGGGGGGTTGTTGYTYIDGGTEIVYLPGTGGGNAGGNAGGNQQNGVNPNNAAPANQQNAADANAADANPADQANQGPTEIVDLDDTDVPLANVSPSPDSQVAPVNPKPGLNGFWIGALALSGLGIFALVAILIMLLKRKRKETYQG